MITMHTNMGFLQAHRYSGIHQNRMSQALQRISTGKKINSAADDPAGLGISQKMRAQIRHMDKQIENNIAEKAMLSTAEGALNETHAMLQRMKALATQASSDTLNDSDRELINIEYQALKDEIDSVYSRTNYNGKKVLREQTIENSVTNIENHPDQFKTPEDPSQQPPGNKTVRQTDILTRENAQEAMDVLESAIHATSSTRAGIGAAINVLDHRNNYLENAAINTEAALSTIEDADIAKEMMEYTKANILMQASQAMMAQSMDNSKQLVQMLKDM